MAKCFPENQFGRPHLRWEDRMFSARWLSISEINITKTVERTSENKNGFLAKDTAIVESDSDCSDWFGAIFGLVLL